MKKIMKKALSLVLVAIMVCIPMSVMAADNTTPDMAEFLMDSYVEVTVGANETLYYMYGNPRMGTGGNKLLTVEATKGISVLTGYDFTGAGGTETPLNEYEGTDWAFLGEYFVKSNMMGSVEFGLKNNTSNPIVCYVSLGEPMGTINNPDVLIQGDNTASTSGGYAGYFYTWTAPKAGTVTITMSDDNSNGWKYKIGEGTEYWSDDSEVVASSSVDVSEWEEIILWVNTRAIDSQYSEVAGDVNFTMTFSATDKDEYIYNYDSIEVGENNLTLDGSAITTIYGFSSDVSGKYTITAPDGCTVSYWGNNEWSLAKESSNETNIYELEYATAGPSVYVGISGATQATVTIERTGDVQTGGGQNPGGGSEYTDYENKVKPEAFTFAGVEENLFYVWVEDSEKTAVLGADGFYHIGTANGPVLYVDIDMDLHPYSENYIVAGLNKIAQEGRLYNYSTKISYNNALLEYAACKDSKTGLYPVTEDIKEILVQYGTGQGWYTLNGPAYMFQAEVDAENAWLFMCCYEADLATEENVKWELGKANDFVIKIDAEYSDFIGVKVNGKELDKANYTVKEGSTIITISSKYMSALADGKYTISAEFYNSVGEEVSFDTVVTVAATSAEVPGGAIQAPSTGDNSNVAVWAIAMVVAAGAAYVVAETKKRAR